MEPVLFSWSGGKDSMLALDEILARPRYDLAALITTVTREYDRISMHGVRRVLLERQAAALGLPLEIIWLSKNATNEEYESKLRELLTRYHTRGVNAVVFGDIFLEDLRQYRENNLARISMHGIYPIWQRDSRALVETLVRRGFKAVTTCVDSQALGREFVGREIDEQFLADLPAHVDPCGENGEFHSFVYQGPRLRERISFTRGEIVLRDNRFYYCDLIPALPAH